MQEGGDSSVLRTERDLPLKVVGLGAGVLVLVMALVPQVFGSVEDFAHRLVAAVLVAVFAFFFVTVSSRIVGLVGVTSNPTSGMTIATLIGTASLFLLLGWTDDAGKMAALTIGTVVAIAASIAGDTSQDLKTGFLLGATPSRQQTGELVGVLTSAVFVCLTVILLANAYGFGTAELPAPQATLMKLVIDGVLEQQLPWGLVGIGVGIALVAELLRIPSLPFAVGVYLPVSTMVPVFFGGLLRWLQERGAPTEEERRARRDRGVLFGSGLVGGEGLLGVVIAGFAGWAATREVPRSWELGTAWAGHAAEWVGLAVFLLLAGIFWRLCRGGRG
jgi:putative OPT family oligopeptide transporter